MNGRDHLGLVGRSMACGAERKTGRKDKKLEERISIQRSYIGNRSAPTLSRGRALSGAPSRQYSADPPSKVHLKVVPDPPSDANARCIRSLYEALKRKDAWAAAVRCRRLLFRGHRIPAARTPQHRRDMGDGLRRQTARRHLRRRRRRGKPRERLLGRNLPADYRQQSAQERSDLRRARTRPGHPSPSPRIT